MIDPKKQYKTRDGREVRIYAVDGGGRLPVHGAASRDGKTWVQESWSIGGEWAPDDLAATPMDLIEVRPRIQRKVWVNVYRGRETIGMTIHDERDEADDYVDHEPRIACVEIDIDVEEGHGL